MGKTDLSSCGKVHTHAWISLRQPLRCGLTIVVCSCVMLGAGQCQARGHQEQSVAEAARQERARKERAKKSHVYTDEDLKRAKILTPEDEERVAAHKQTPPAVGETAQPALDAGLQMPELPLGDIARRYRNAKQILQETAPFHLPFDEPAFAAPVMELPKVAPPLPSLTASQPRIVTTPPKKVTAPNVASTAPSAPLRRVNPFAPRFAPAAPRPELHTEAVTPHVPSASARVVPAAPRMESATPGAGAEMRLPSVRSGAPKPSVHTEVAVPRVPANRPIETPAPSLHSRVPGAQLSLPAMQPASPKMRPHISAAMPHLALPVQRDIPAVPRMERATPDAATQLTLPGTEPAVPKPTLNLAPVAPHVPAVVAGAPPAAPRMERTLAGTAEALPEINPEVTPVAPTVVADAPLASGNAARSITVQRGDSLWKIALRTLGRGSRWHELVAANPMIADPTRLEIGTNVTVPNKTLSLKAEEKSVIVWRGDSLTRITQANYGRASAWRCVAEANPEIKDANRIYEGQRVKLPASCKP